MIKIVVTRLKRKRPSQRKRPKLKSTKLKSTSTGNVPAERSHVPSGVYRHVMYENDGMSKDELDVLVFLWHHEPISSVGVKSYNICWKSVNQTWTTFVLAIRLQPFREVSVSCLRWTTRIHCEISFRRMRDDTQELTRSISKWLGVVQPGCNLSLIRHTRLWGSPV